jgi:hypothetical protein
VFDWLLTVFCFGGRTCPGDEFPNWDAAEAGAKGVLHASGLVAGGRRWNHPVGVSIVDAEPVSLTRDTDDAGNAVVVVTLADIIVE